MNIPGRNYAKHGPFHDISYIIVQHGGIMLYLTCQHGRFCAIILHISYTHVYKPGLIYAISYMPYFLHEVNMADFVL